jgi:ubiquitin carboxyl-terminal hydrolase 9/24
LPHLLTLPSAPLLHPPAQGRLQLLLALVTTLDRRCVGAGREAGLIQLLISEYLFPQARLAQDERAGRLVLAQCGARLRPRCAAPGARRAALELAAELMREGTGPLEEGVRCLEALLGAASPTEFHLAPPKHVRRPGDYCGLRNAGATCYMNAVFQQLYMQPRIRALILGAPEVPEPERPDSVFAQLQAVFASMALGLASFMTPDGFWRAFKDYDGQPIDTREHQDAYEFFTRLQVRGRRA